MHNKPNLFVLVIKEWHVHRPGELVVNVGIDNKGVPVPLPPPLVRLGPPAPIFLPVIPLPLLGLVPPCQLALRPALKPYPKGAESLLALDNRLLLPPLPPTPAPDTKASLTAAARFSFDVRCLFTLTRSSLGSVSKGFIDGAVPGLGGNGVDVADSALELG